MAAAVITIVAFRPTTRMVSDRHAKCFITFLFEIINIITTMTGTATTPLTTAFQNSALMGVR